MDACLRPPSPSGSSGPESSSSERVSEWLSELISVRVSE